MNSYLELAILLVSIGSAWGHLRAGQNRNGRDITSIKKALGLENGSPPAFIRREEWDTARTSQEAMNEQFNREMIELWRRVP